MSSSPTLADPQPVGGPGVTRFVTRGGHRLSYESRGAAAGTPVLALHDLLADRRQFRSLAEMLERAGFRVMLPDARGHGGSAMISGRVYTAHDSGADALAVLEGEGVPPAHVVAAGWGAAAALAMASAAPHRVRSLLLVEPLLPELPGAATNARAGASRQAEIVREAGLAASKGLTERAVDLYLGMRLGEGWRDALPKPHLAAMRRAVGSLGPHLTGLASETLASEALRHLDVPVTLLLSAAANPDERDTVEALALLLPRSRTELAPLATKMAMAPDPWMEAIAMALRTSAPSPRS